MNNAIKKFLPSHIDETDLQWSGNINGIEVNIFFDDSDYALFSEKGFHGWLKLGFTMSEIIFVANYQPTNYMLVVKE